MQQPRRELLATGAVLSFGLVCCTAIITRGVEHTVEHARANEVSVKGYAEKKITSDLGVWHGSFTVRGPELVGTYEDLKKQQSVVSSWLAKMGVPAAAVEWSAVSTSIDHKRTSQGVETNEIEDYALTQGVTVEGNDIALITKVAQQSTSLIASGVAFDSSTPQWFYTKLDSLKIEMLGEAAKDARVRAEKIAEASHGHVGGLRSADQGVFQITAPTSTEVSGFGELDTSSITKSVKAIVTVRYAVEE